MNSHRGFLGLHNNLGRLISLASLMAIVAIVVPWFLRVRARARYTTCTSKLYDVANALERYAEDHDDALPANLGQLTPEYLNRIPNCPQIDERTYTMRVSNAPANPNFYLLECMGDQHTVSGHPPDYPKLGRGQGAYSPEDYL